MISPRFVRHTLRTIDVAAAAAFYDAVLGAHDHPIVPLHEQARARGARPHWLGRVGSDHPGTIEAALRTMEEAGAQRLGPHPEGGVVLREPGGALLAVGGPQAPAATGVGWHVLRTPDPEAAASLYGAAFGWTLGAPGAIDGVTHHSWSAAAGEPPFGSLAGLAEGVHPQWMVFFAVPSLDDAIAAVRGHGGLALDPSEVGGRRFVACDDPQGAAFGLVA